MASTVVSKEMPPQTLSNFTDFINDIGGGSVVTANYEAKGLHSDLIRSVLKVERINHGRITCSLNVKPYVCNGVNTFHGGAVASIAEIVAIACARTVVDKDKELFLGDLSISYLAPSVNQAEVIVEASVVRKGRNLTIVGIEFKLKDSQRLTYMCRATFYNMPLSSL